MCELLVGLPDVNVLGVDDTEPEGPLRVHVETRPARPRCGNCDAEARVKERPEVELVDLPAFGRPARLVWRKHRWECPDPVCVMGSWTGDEPRIASRRLGLTDRAGRWATIQVGRWGRTVNEVAGDLGCDWHTVNDTVIAYGTALVDDPDRIGEVNALGLDETLFGRAAGGVTCGRPASSTL
jgi:transposase